MHAGTYTMHILKVHRNSTYSVEDEDVETGSPSDTCEADFWEQHTALKVLTCLFHEADSLMHILLQKNSSYLF